MVKVGVITSMLTYTLYGYIYVNIYTVWLFHLVQDQLLFFRLSSLHFVVYDLSRFVGKPDFLVCENKGADQLCNNCTADLHLCIRYTDLTILLHKYKISSF